MPFMFDNNNSAWPDPEQSIGKECLSISGLRCWLPIGPALAAFEILSKDLQALLDKHKDALKQGEPKPRAISFNMWMTGSKPESSSPTIVFSSKSPRQRAFAKALLKDSKLLDQYPGVRIKTLDRMPAMYQAGSQQPDTIDTTRESTDDVSNDGSEEAIYMVDDSRGSCGALIAFGRLRLATMGGILFINGTYYGISAQHGRYEFLKKTENAPNEANSLCFDDDSDTEDSDLDNLIEIASRESRSSYSDENSSTLSFTSSTSTRDRIFEHPTNLPRTTEDRLDHNSEVPCPFRPTYLPNPKISNLLPYERNDLDYEVFEIHDPHYHNSNMIDLPSSGDPIRHIIPNKIARTLVECPVWAATGTTGCVQGTMMRQPHYIKMEGSETFQEMWAVKLDRNTKPGDSGAWVVDSAGHLFGHIVAGDPMLGLAFIIPAYNIFEDIKSRFGEEPWLCPSSSIIQSYNALNDGRNAEQLLLDLFKGKGTGTTIQLGGFPSVEKAVTAEFVAAYARRAPYSIDYGDLAEDITKIGGDITKIGGDITKIGGDITKIGGDITKIGEDITHLGERITKIEENLEMIRCYGHIWILILPIQKAHVFFISNLHAANWTRLRRAEQYLQTGVQEVPTAFSRGDLLGTSMIMTGTSNQPMAAAFNATASSAQPSSFGSMVPSIGAYTYIGIDLPRTNDWILGAGFSTTNSFLRSAYQSKSSTIGDQRGEPWLRCPFRGMGCPRKYGRMHTAQWLAHQLSHFDTSQSTWLDTRRTCTREQAISFAWMDTIAEHYGYRYHTAFGFSTFECHYLGMCLNVTEKLRLEEEYGAERAPAWWYCHYWVLLFLGLRPGAFGAYDPRQFRRRRLNAPRQREDNSQCSESSERERP